jgi:hypothetical protein
MASLPKPRPIHSSEAQAREMMEEARKEFEEKYQRKVRDVAAGE